MMQILILFSLISLQAAIDLHNCLSCRVFFNTLQDLINNKHLLETGGKWVIDICSLFEHREICEGYVGIYGPAYIQALSEKYLSPDRVCTKIGSCSRPQYAIENFEKYQEEVLQDMPPINPWPKAGNNTFLVLHITDIHADFLYQPGSEVNCDWPLCCRNGTGTAGYWGTRAKCDLPIHTLEAFLETFNQYNISFVIWTGDNPPHDVWAYEREKEMNYTRTITELFKKYINVPVFPIIGNHDCFPLDFFNPNHEEILIGNLSELWEGWLGPEQIKEFSANGFYSALEPKTGFRIIGMNNELGDNMNVHLIPNDTDPGEMLTWLRNELYQAEQNNESVIILGHIPHGDKYMDSYWARHYRVLANRFQNIIKGQFFGHTHNDEFFVVHSLIPGVNPPGVLIAAPTFGTQSYQNPSFRIYEFDIETKQLVNIHQYRLPLYLANNETSQTDFQKVFDYKTLYSIPDMSPNSFLEIAEKLLNDSNFGQIFYENWVAQYPQEAAKCDEKCQKYLYCRLSNDVFDEVLACDIESFNQYMWFGVLEMLQGDWEYLIE